MPRVALHTLGCKVNQYETQEIAEAFLSRGFEVVEFGEEADVYIINSCTVTQTADSKSRQAARSVLQRNPRGTVILTGCYAETSPEEAAGVTGVTKVIGNREKHLLVQKVVELLGISDGERDHPEDCIQRKYGRTRALLKIQDGCDQFCAYCAVPLARPVMWSRPLHEVLSEALKLARNGYKEIVLTGIRLGMYLDDGKDLTDLLIQLATIGGIERIRLSSIEVTDVPPGLLDLLASERKICRHLHIPLQSGDDEVLSRMNRPYNSPEFVRFIESARSVVPEIGITTDIMVGFPGETRLQFQRTCEVVERIRFSRAHIFRYSRRSGTHAASMPEDVTSQEKGERSARLAELTSRHSREFAERMVGKTVEVLVEAKEVCRGVRSGLTNNYVRFSFEADESWVGKIASVHVESISSGRLVCEP